MIFRVEIDILPTKTVYSYGATNQKTAVIPNFRDRFVDWSAEAIVTYCEPADNKRRYPKSQLIFEIGSLIGVPKQ